VGKGASAVPTNGVANFVESFRLHALPRVGTRFALCPPYIPGLHGMGPLSSLVINATTTIERDHMA
jgi:hypothetical protein